MFIIDQQYMDLSDEFNMAIYKVLRNAWVYYGVGLDDIDTHMDFYYSQCGL
jgi:hypothetical protein